ncbi:13991_t:CDS:2, partial [Dentiscutata erythropus]
YKDSSVLPTEFAKKLVEQLANVEQSLGLPAHWTLAKVRHRWYYRYKKLKKSQPELVQIDAPMEDT